MPKTFKFKDLQEVNNVMAQLPAEARSITTTLLLNDTGNGYEMTVPDQLENVIKQADKAKPAPAANHGDPQVLGHDAAHGCGQDR
jgi:hypothetical protein